MISNVSGTNVYSISGDQGYKNDRITQAYKVAKSETWKTISLLLTITQEEMEENWPLWDITTSLDDTNLNMRYVDYGEGKQCSIRPWIFLCKYGETASFLQ